LQQQRHHSIPQANQSIYNAQLSSIVSSTQNQHFNQQDIQKTFIDHHKPLQQINTAQKAPIVQQLTAVHPSQISQPQQQNVVQKQPNVYIFLIILIYIILDSTKLSNYMARSISYEEC
jgi:hypothetical protein